MIDPYIFGVKLAGGGVLPPAPALASGQSVPYNQQQAVTHMLDRKIPGVTPAWYAPELGDRSRKRYTALGTYPPGQRPNRFQRDAGKEYNGLPPGDPILPAPAPALVKSPINPLQH